MPFKPCPTGSTIAALVVEPDPRRRADLCRALGACEGPRVRARGVGSWDEACRALPSKPCDVVLLAGRAAPALAPVELQLAGFEIPVVLVASHPRERDRHRARASGFAEAVVAAGAGPTELGQALARAVETLGLRRALVQARAELENRTRALAEHRREVRELRRQLARGSGRAFPDDPPARLRRMPAARLVEAAVDRLTPAAEARGVGLFWSSRGDTRAWLEPDVALEVLCALVDRAVHGVPPGGTVRARTRPTPGGVVARVGGAELRGPELLHHRARLARAGGRLVTACGFRARAALWLPALPPASLRSPASP